MTKNPIKISNLLALDFVEIKSEHPPHFPPPIILNPKINLFEKLFHINMMRKVQRLSSHNIMSLLENDYFYLVLILIICGI